MSNTTIANSKAIQALLNGSEARLGQPPAGTSAKGTPSFQQMLEGALEGKSAPGEKASETPSRGAPAMTDGSRPRKLETPNALSNKSVKIAEAGSPSPKTAGRDPAQLTLPPSPPVSRIDGKAALAASNGDREAPILDATQLKVVNAPSLPDPPPAALHTASTANPSRAQPETLKPTQSGGVQAPAGSPAPALSSTPRGFAQVLAGAHAAASTPASIAEQAAFDPSLRMSVGPQGARLSMDTAGAGSLNAQLQITNGVADVRLTGEAASLLVRHGAELSLGLTSAGLQPGRVEIAPATSTADAHSTASDGTGSRSFQGNAGTDSDPNPRHEPRSEPTPQAPASTLHQRASRVHVKA